MRTIQALQQNNPELHEILQFFMEEEVKSQITMEKNDRHLAILAAILGCQGHGLFENAVIDALDEGVEAAAIVEVVYQSVAYCGIARIYEFVMTLDSVFQKKGIAQPLASQKTTTLENRFEKGLNLQIEMFGPHMKDQLTNAPEDIRHIRQWLADNCFGDYYTRAGLTLRQREMITLCFLIAQGGCESQVKGHVAGNLNCGNNRQYLISVISQCMPYLGYPRTLNALRVLDEVTNK